MKIIQSFDDLEFQTVECVERRNVASILLTKDSIFIGVGHAFETIHISPRLSQVELHCVREIEGNHRDQVSKRVATNKQDLLDAMALIFELAPTVTHICVSSFGPYRLVGRHNRHDSDYGQFDEISNYSEWSQMNLYEELDFAAKKQIGVLGGVGEGKKIKKYPEILIALDVNAAALGEHYYRLEREIRDDKRNFIERCDEWDERLATYAKDTKFDKLSESDQALYTALEDQVHRYNRNWRRTSAYLKVSNSVNVGYVTNGWIARDSGYMQAGAYRPRPYMMRGGRYVFDDFKGACRKYGNSIEGLVSMPALAKRFSRFSTLKESDVTLKDILDAYPISDGQWVWVTRYIAELAHSVSCMIAPKYIALGGIVLTGPERGREGGWEELIEMVRSRFYRLLWRDMRDEKKSRATPDYAEILDLGQFIKYRECKYPSIFGGLILARWDKTGLYPLPTEKMLDGSGRRREIFEHTIS